MNRIAIMAVATAVMSLGLLGYTVFQDTQPSPERQSYVPRDRFVAPTRYEEQGLDFLKGEDVSERLQRQEIERLQRRVRELEGK